VEELRNLLEAKTGKRIRVNINEIRMPELDAHLVARNIADQLERRVAFRRALKQTVARTMARGAEGCKAMVAGRLGGSEMSRREATMDGRVPLHTIRANIDFGRAEAHTTFGRIGVKVWIYKGEILPERREEAAEELGLGAAETPPSSAAGAVEDGAPPAGELVGTEAEVTPTEGAPAGASDLDEKPAAAPTEEQE
jgi:small subunit ribosomal protein S3